MLCLPEWESSDGFKIFYAVLNVHKILLLWMKWKANIRQQYLLSVKFQAVCKPTNSIFFFRKHALLPRQHCWLTLCPCCATGACFLCTLQWVSRAQYLLFHQFSNTAFLPTTFKTAGPFWMCQNCCVMFSIIFSFPGGTGWFLKNRQWCSA